MEISAEMSQGVPCFGTPLGIFALDIFTRAREISKDQLSETKSTIFPSSSRSDVIRDICGFDLPVCAAASTCQSVPDA